MKRVSFEVAKALKKVGYQQGETDSVYVTKDTHQFDEGELVDSFWVSNNIVDAPYAIHVWLWLWREKSIHIDIIDSKITTQCYATINNEKDTILFNNPEEAIIAAIEYLVDNDLIK